MRGTEDAKERGGAGEVIMMDLELSSRGVALE